MYKKKKKTIVCVPRFYKSKISLKTQTKKYKIIIPLPGFSNWLDIIVRFINVGYMKNGFYTYIFIYY